MSSESPVIDRESIERTLCQIAEVEAVRVVLGNDREILEVHVLASGQKAPRQIVRDIESLLLTVFDLPIDHKKISVALIQAPTESATSHQGRPRIRNIRTDISDGQARVEVVLTHDGAEGLGSAEGPASQNGRLRLAALAALDAARKFQCADINWTLEHAEIVQAGGTEKIALTCLSALSKAGEKRHTGSAMVKVDEADAIVKATLSALNRNLASKR
jgi:hypothetical protein